ncbi:TPA: glycosyltransferase [Vibrio vulnificus]|nr:hypothetical protein [Vibrio vulnificus]
MSRVILSSLTYLCKGHSKSYIDSFFYNAKKNREYILFSYGKPENHNDFPVISFDAEPDVLNYSSNQRLSSERKIIKRFIKSFRFYLEMKRVVKHDDFIYFMDYEYISFLICVLLFRKHRKLIWIHAPNLGAGFYKLYKGFFFKLIKHFSGEKTSFVVNGEKAKMDLLNILGNVDVTTLQYPCDVELEPECKDEAKVRLGFEGKTVFSCIGMVRKDKNYDVLMRIFSNSRFCNSNDAVLLIAGSLSGVEKEYVEGLAKRYNVRNVDFRFGYLTLSQMNSYFSATDIYLMAYGNNGSSQSGPLSMCRHYLVPAIVFDGGEIGYYVNKYKVGLASTDEKNFTENLDNMKVEEFLDNLMSAKSELSWVSLSLKYEKLFERIIDGK